MSNPMVSVCYRNSAEKRAEIRRFYVKVPPVTQKRFSTKCATAIVERVHSTTQSAVIVACHVVLRPFLRGCAHRGQAN